MTDAPGTMLHDQATRLFRDLATPELLQSAASGRWPGDAWSAVANAGLHLALLEEAAGGFGVTAVEALGVLRAAGAAALPLPLAETMLAIKVLGDAGLAIPDGPLSAGPVVGAAPELTRDGDNYRLQATLRRVPWGRDAAWVAVVATDRGEPMAACIPASAWRCDPATNMAGEPRDTLAVDALLPPEAVAPSRTDHAGLRVIGAAMRTQQIAGCLGTVCDMTVTYAQDRKQFGRPIGKFQAIQQSLAILAGQAAAAMAAADLAAEALEPALRPLAVAAAKSRAGEAAGIAAGIAHQVHGAIGFTQEHSLHHFTKRLWSWRDEFGTEAAWNDLLGRHFLAAGADRLWPGLTAL